MLRKEVLSKRDELSWDEIEAKSKKIADFLFALPEYIEADTVMYFLNFGKEVQTLDMVPLTLNHGKVVAAPKTVHREKKMLLSQITDVDDDLAPGLWGIPEPKPEKIRAVNPLDLDFVVVPGVAFDEQGNRLGYGGGYYDRFFQQLRPGVPLVAAVFEEQILPAVPAEPWDCKVDLIITDIRIIDCRNK